jgi:SlyX protein
MSRLYGKYLTMSEDRLTKIETLLAHQDQQIQDLSEVLNLQRKEIDALKVRLERTQKKLIEVEAGAGAGEEKSLSVTEQALRDKPPHY